MHYIHLMLGTFPSYNFSNMQFPKRQATPSQIMEINACLVLKIDIKMTLKCHLLNTLEELGLERVNAEH